MDQYNLFTTLPTERRKPDVIDVLSAYAVDPSSYDYVIVAFSGGKDSVASVLFLLSQGIKPELWHHDVDGQGDNLFDWPITRAYCQAFADAFGLKIYFSWREGGLKTELLKHNDRTKPMVFETPDGIMKAGGERGSITTRQRFPALSPSLLTRWCSSSAKIEPGAAAISNQPRFKNKRTLIITGERAEESSARAKYQIFEPHRTHAPGPRARRHVDHWRPVLHWTEAQVWSIMKEYRVDAHPCYHLGWSRASCQTCIFGSKNQWASNRLISPDRFNELVGYERDFGHTIRNGITLPELADSGTPYEMDPAMVALAMSTSYDKSIILDNWVLPKGAYGENAGPT